MTVSVPTLWLIAAVVLGLSELLVGTFYLLLLGVAALVGAIVALAGFALEIQCLLAAAVVLVGGVILARYRAHHKKDAKGLANDNLDIGQTVTVARWDEDGTASVSYRGAQWKARTEHQNERTPGIFTIVGVTGSVLVLKRRDSNVREEGK